MSEVKNPLFSIILPTFNRRAMCERAIRSVLRQDDPDWELIVVDDGSSDGTRETVSSLGIPNVRYLWTENHGAANARNLGIRAATGQFICFLDSDDEYLPNHLAVLRDALGERHPPLMLFTLAFLERGSKRTPLPDHTNTPSLPILLGDNPETPCICIDSRTLKSNPFDARCSKHEDAELWGRIAKIAPVTKVPLRTVVVHSHEGPRMSLRTEGYWREMIVAYDLIQTTQNIRTPIPAQALRRQWQHIYFGLMDSTRENGISSLWQHSSDLARRSGLRSLFHRRYFRIMRDHLRHILSRRRV